MRHFLVTQKKAEAGKLKSIGETVELKIEYHQYSGMVHAWMFLSLPESKKARQQIIELIK